MNVLIVEDEKPAADRLEKLLKELEPDVHVMGVVVSVASAVKWLSGNELPDLLLMDVNLADGSSFEIFDKVNVAIPVVFITAYDEYALEAFRVNSIDYLLKPVKREDLQRALERFHSRTADMQAQLQMLIRQLRPANTFQKRLVIRYGEVIKMVETKDVAYFYTENRINYLCTFDNLRYPVDQNLDELEGVLDPSVFFRINRQFIVNVGAIDKMTAWSKSRVKLTLQPACPIETIVSTERSPVFKEWLTGLN
jgi:two-component system LytT family response regulator